MFPSLAVVLKTSREDKIALAEIVQDRIDNDADGHLAVTCDLIRTTEIEKSLHRGIAQYPFTDRRCDHIVRNQVTHHDLKNEAQCPLPSGFAILKKDVFASKIPDHAAERIVYDRSNMLIKATEIEQEEHDARTQYEIENADDGVIQERAIHHLLQLLHITTIFLYFDLLYSIPSKNATFLFYQLKYFVRFSDNDNMIVRLEAVLRIDTGIERCTIFDSNDVNLIFSPYIQLYK